MHNIQLISDSFIEQKCNFNKLIDSLKIGFSTPNIQVPMRHLQEGQHLDLVGAYKKDSREADDEAVRKSSVFLDTYQGDLKESGDIVIPLNNGTLKLEDIKVDLFELCNGTKKGRTSEKEITYFKSVGHALEDLVAASYFYNEFIKSKDTH